MRRILIAAALLLALAALRPQPAVAEESVDLCRAATVGQEQLGGLPDHLLSAISLVESGRWDETRRARIAWPWTVMAEGKGRYLPTKAAAIAEVRALQAKGVRNIDVGCMQVNLHWHGDAFDSLEEAFDPRANASYAADFLTNLYAETGDWNLAAAWYHSRTPERAEYYSGKVRVALAELSGSPTVDPAHDADVLRIAAIRKQIEERRDELVRAREIAERLLAEQRATARAFAEDWRRQKLQAYKERQKEDAAVAAFEALANQMRAAPPAQ